MIDNRNTHRNPVSTGFEPRPLEGAEAFWVASDLNLEPAEPPRKRILLVEDQAMVRACLRLMLELEGHQVTEASNGAEALNLFTRATRGEFDLVVTDLDMPVMAGNQLALGLRLLVPSLPILMITASDRAERNADNPVDVLLRKPCSVGRLHQALQELLAARRQPAAPTKTFPPEQKVLSLPA